MESTNSPVPDSGVPLCGSCGKVITASKASKRKYCDQKCYGNARRGTSATWNVKEPIFQECPACGKVFSKGRNTGISIWTKYCSELCCGRHHFKGGYEANTLSDLDAAYLAGFIDGEGCILLHKQQVRHLAVYLRLYVANTNEAIIRWCGETAGVGSVRQHRKPDGRNKPQWSWTCSSIAAQTVLRQLLPFLRVKKPQAELALEFIERKDGQRETIAGPWQEEYCQRMKALNKRGPA